VTIKDGGFVGESRRKTARESKNGEIINAKLRAELLDVLASTKNISKVSLDDIIGQEVAKKAMLELKPFLDPEYACLYADDEDSEEDSKSNTGILLFGPPGTVSHNA
jgi:SpoVK/Ycf46/Vps4 family AAA+-type ATPase